MEKMQVIEYRGIQIIAVHGRYKILYEDCTIDMPTKEDVMAFIDEIAGN